MLEIILGTNNRKKGLELAELLVPYKIDVKTLADFPEKLSVQEDGETFIENARKKAKEQAVFLNKWVIGEDSGLCVDALDGAPGVFSARFAAGSDDMSNSSDEENNALLLAKLAGIPLEKRTAHYVCTAAIAAPDGTIHGESKGICRGRILFEASGTGGFGYDPLFEIMEFHRTFGALSPAVKRVISHRARAMRSLIPLLIEITK
ncbi:non-canonical purine NTP pyrophosphatase [Planctomycetales bacterium]|nr:non-canonical purine NTP pyrophosphatase [Planctomycetales bacterium]